MAQKSLVGKMKAAPAEEAALVLPNAGPLAGYVQPPEKALEGGEGGSPYARFCSPKADEHWGQVDPLFPDLREGDIVIHNAGPEKETKLLRPARFFLISAYQYWAKVDGAFKIVPGTVGFDKPSFDEERKSGLKEFAEALVLFYDGGNIYPASFSARTTKAGAIIAASQALVSASSPEWGKKSEAHKNSLRFPNPFGRVISEVKITKRIVKSGDNAGKPYLLAKSVSEPSTAEHWDALLRFFQEEGNKETLESAKENYERRKADVEKLAG